MNNIVKKIGLYFMGSSLSKGMTFLLLPLYTRYISPSSFGKYDLYMTYINISIPVITMSIWIGILRYMLDVDRYQKEKIISYGLKVLAISLAAYTVIFFITTLFFPVEYYLLVYIYGLLYAISSYYLYIARGYGLTKIFTISGIAMTFTILVINSILLIQFKANEKALYISIICGLLVQILIVEKEINIRKLIFKRTEISNGISIIKFSIPYCLNSFFWCFLDGFNRIIVVKHLGIENNGYLATAARITIVMQLIYSSINMAWQENAFGAFREKISDLNNHFTLATKNLIEMGIMSLAIIIPLINIMFKTVVNQEYYLVKSLIPMSLIANFMSMVAQFQGSILGSVKRTKPIFYSTILAAVINIITIMILIKSVKLQAANIALFFGFFINVIVRTTYLKKYLEYKINLLRTLKYASIIIVNIMIYFLGSSLLNILCLFLSATIIICLYYKRTMRYVQIIRS